MHRDYYTIKTKFCKDKKLDKFYRLFEKGDLFGQKYKKGLDIFYKVCEDKDMKEGIMMQFFREMNQQKRFNNQILIVLGGGGIALL